MVFFLDETSYEQMSKYCYGSTFYVNNMWWKIVMDDWNLDEKSLGKW